MAVKCSRGEVRVTLYIALLAVRDPKTFSEPVEKPRYRDWRPEIIVNTYNCEQDQQLH